MDSQRGALSSSIRAQQGGNGSLAAKLSASQVIDQDPGQYSGTRQYGGPGNSPPGPLGGAAARRGSLPASSPPPFPSSLASLSSLGLGGGGTAGAASLGLPSHLWAALEQRWASTEDGGSGGGSGTSGGGGGGGGGGVLLSVDDEMDRHPCMVPLVLMLERACQVEGAQQAQQQGMPEWASSLLRVLRSEGASR